MSGTLTIFRRELRSYFATPVAYVFIVIFLFLKGWFTFYLGNFYEREQADLRSFFSFHPWLYLFLIPAISMRLWSEERKTGTIELLMTLPVTLPQADVLELRRQLRDRPGATISVDLASQSVSGPDGRQYQFEIHPVRKKCLLEGLDDVARTSEYDEAAAVFEAAYKAERPWLYQPPPAH
jgi:hypothetical protein